MALDITQRSGKNSSRGRVHNAGGLAQVLPSRSSWRGGLAAALLPQLCQATQAGDSRGPQMLWDLGKFLRNEMEHRLPGTTLRAQGAWKGMKGLCFEIIRKTCLAGGCQLAAHSSLQLPVAPVVMGGLEEMPSRSNRDTSRPWTQGQPRAAGESWFSLSSGLQK